MILTIVVFFLVLGLLVLVHEAGHFFVARRFGVRVDEFGLGIPPRIIGFYKNEAGKWKAVGPKVKQTNSTIWSLNWIPLGGFVKIKGEEGEAAGEPDSFGFQKVWKRISIIASGVTMNILLAMILLTIGLMIGVPQYVDQSDLPRFAHINSQKVIIADVFAEPAKSADIKIGDAIISIDGTSLASIKELQDYFSQRVGLTSILSIDRDGQTIQQEITPQILVETEKSGIGVGLVETAILSYPWYVAWWYGIIGVLQMMWGVILGFFLIIKSLILSGKMIGEVYGPIGIASLTGQAARLGFNYLLQFTATLSVIIAVINFLPIPALDGGRIVFLLIEGWRGKPVNQKVENLIHNAGFLLLMILMLAVTFRDIIRFSGLFDRIAALF